MMIDSNQIVTTAEIAERLEEKIKAVRRWTERREANGFPEPIKTVQNYVHLYDFDEVNKWFEVHKQKWGAYYAD